LTIDLTAVRHAQSASIATTRNLSASNSPSVVKATEDASVLTGSVAMTAQNHFVVHCQMARIDLPDRTIKKHASA